MTDEVVSSGSSISETPKFVPSCHFSAISAFIFEGSRTSLLKIIVIEGTEGGPFLISSALSLPVKPGPLPSGMLATQASRYL